MALVVLSLGTVASAHLGSTKLISISRSPDGASAQIDLDPIDVAFALGLDDAEHAQASALLPRAAQIQAWAADVFTLRADHEPCEVEVGDVGLSTVEGLRFEEAIRLELQFTCSTGPEVERTFYDDAVFATDRQHEAIVVFEGNPTVLRVGRQAVPLRGAPSLGSTLTTFLLEGAIHLVTGYDHILFLLTLLLAAGELAARKGKKEALRDVAMIVTAFTLGHSVTLIAAALDVVALPSRWVESAIAASIVAVAAWNLVRPEARDGLRWVAAVFGLIHGFGFSSVLRELVLPTGERVGALLAFNVGIELAQLAIVVLVVPLLAWAGGRPWYRRVVIQGGSLLISLVAAYWFVTRAFMG